MRPMERHETHPPHVTGLRDVCRAGAGGDVEYLGGAVAGAGGQVEFTEVGEDHAGGGAFAAVVGVEAGHPAVRAAVAFQGSAYLSFDQAVDQQREHEYVQQCGGCVCCRAGRGAPRPGGP